MDEHLQLHIGAGLTDVLDLLEGKFTGENHPLKAKTNQLAYTADCMHSQLGACMKRKGGKQGPDDLNKPQILDDDAVAADECNLLEGLHNLTKL